MPTVLVGSVGAEGVAIGTPVLNGDLHTAPQVLRTQPDDVALPKGAGGRRSSGKGGSLPQARELHGVVAADACPQQHLGKRLLAAGQVKRLPATAADSEGLARVAQEFGAPLEMHVADPAGLSEPKVAVQSLEQRLRSSTAVYTYAGCMRRIVKTNLAERRRPFRPTTICGKRAARRKQGQVAHATTSCPCTLR